MNAAAAHRVPRAALLGLLTGLVGLSVASGAHAADRVYWANFAQDQISYANLDGSGMQDLNTSGATVNEPIGTALDPVSGRIYWANHTGGVISYANLDGTGGGGDFKPAGAPMKGPMDIAIDPASRRIWWSNDDNAQPFGFATLDGSSGGEVKVPGAAVEGPYGIAVDPAGGRIYWTNFGFIGGSIGTAKLDGSGGTTLPIMGATLDTPLGIAIDRAASKLYWANDNPGKVSFANLDGSGAGDLNMAGATGKGIYGVAFDPTAGRLYWANTQGATLAFAETNGSGGSNLRIPEDPKATANFPVLYEEPRAVSGPTLDVRGPVVPKAARASAFGGGTRKPFPLPQLVGSGLSCATGAWAADLVEASLYRAPLSIAYGWIKDGAPMAGVVGERISVAQPGVYRCQVTASNGAGSTSQTTAAAATIFATGKATLNRKKGTARLAVALPATPGTLTLGGGGLVARARSAAGTTTVVVKAKGAKKAALAKKGSVKTVVRLTFAPADGPSATLGKRLTLRAR